MPREKLPPEEEIKAAEKEAWTRYEQVEAMVKKAREEGKELTPAQAERLLVVSEDVLKKKEEESPDKVTELLRENAEKKILEPFKKEVKSTHGEKMAELIIYFGEKVAKREIEKILADTKMSNEEKNKAIGKFGFLSEAGREDGKKFFYKAEDILSKYEKEAEASKGDIRKTKEIKRTFTYILKGYFVETLFCGRPAAAIRSLEEIAKINDQKPSEVIEEYNDIISEIRTKVEGLEPKEASKSVGMHSKQYIEFLDDSMEENGFLFDRKEKKYVSLEK